MSSTGETQREKTAITTTTLTRSVRMSLRASLSRRSADYHQFFPPGDTAKLRLFSTWSTVETRNRLPLEILTQEKAELSDSPKMFNLTGCQKLPDFMPDPELKLPLNTSRNRLSVVSERSENCYEEQKLVVEMQQSHKNSSASSNSSTDKDVSPPLYDNIDVEAKLKPEQLRSGRFKSDFNRSFNVGSTAKAPKSQRAQKYHTITIADKKFSNKPTLSRSSANFCDVKPTRYHQRSRSYDLPLTEPIDPYHTNRSCENIFGTYRHHYPNLYRSNGRPSVSDNSRNYNSLPYIRQFRNRNFAEYSAADYRNQENFEFRKPFGSFAPQPAYQFVPVVPSISGNCLFYPPPPVPTLFDGGAYCNPYSIPPTSHYLPPDKKRDSSSIDTPTKRTRNCLIGWIIGVTAVLVLILAITLFIQMQKDTADLTASLATAGVSSWTTPKSVLPSNQIIGSTRPISWKLNQQHQFIH